MPEYNSQFTRWRVQNIPRANKNLQETTLWQIIVATLRRLMTLGAG